MKVTVDRHKKKAYIICTNGEGCIIDGKNPIPKTGDLVIREEDRLVGMIMGQYHDREKGRKTFDIMVIAPKSIYGDTIAYRADEFVEDFIKFHGKITLEQ